MHQRWSWRLMALIAFATLALFVVPTAWAAGPGEDQSAQADNQACLACHSNPSLTVKLPSGETMSLYTDPARYNASMHGQQGQKCTACHTGITTYPHPALTAKDIRDVQLSMASTCRQCHDKQFQQTGDSIHAKAFAAGDRNAPTCSDCHTSHYVISLKQQPLAGAQACDKCHSTIFTQYKASVHGAALTASSNPDVPTCVDCHGVHNIGDPTTNAFRLKSPEICAGCHTDKTKMAKYNLSTDVVNTYVADFHGTTVAVFEKQSPNAPTNKAVCTDCHGVHNIKKVDDPKSTVFRDNLLKTCQQCHPDATSNFPASWLMHYSASPQQFPLVYYVNLFYTILVPLVIGGMVLFVLSDATRRILNRGQKGKGA